MAIQLRRGNKADLVPANLLAGEPALALDTKEFGLKLNDGSMLWLTPSTRKIAGIDLSTDLTLSELIAAGLASGTNGDADNALKLGGVLAANFPQISSGTYTPYMCGGTTAGTPTHTAQTGSYYRIGKLVVIKGHIAISSKGGMDGTALIKGLPAPAPGSPGGAVNFFFTSGYSITGSLQGEVEYDFLGLHQAESTECKAVLATNISDNFAAYFAGYYIAS